MRYGEDRLLQLSSELEDGDAEAALDGRLWVPMSRFARFCVLSGIWPQITSEPWLSISKRTFWSARHQHLWLVHRGSSKSRGMMALASYCLCEGDKLEWFGGQGRVCYAAEDSTMGRDQGDTVRQTLVGNEWVVAEYGSQKPTKRLMDEWEEWLLGKGLDPEAVGRPVWKAGAFKTMRSLRYEMERNLTPHKEPSFMALGYDQGGTGKHYELLLDDDPSTTKNSESVLRKTKVKRVYHDLQSQRMDSGYELISGTRHAEDDLHGQILTDYWQNYQIELHPCWEPELEKSDFQRDARGFYVLKRPLSAVKIFWDGYERISEDVKAAEEGAEPYSDEERKRRAIHHLAGKLHTLPSSVFSHQFLNQPVSREDQIFYEDMFQPYRNSDVAGTLAHYVLTDSATGTDFRSSYRVVAVASFDHRDNAYIRDISFGRWNPEEYVEIILKAWLQWSPRFVLMEKISFQAFAKTTLELLCRVRGIQMPRIVDIPGRSLSTKLERIEGLQPRLSAARNHSENPKLMFDPGLREKLQDGKKVWQEMVAQFKRVHELKFAKGLILDVPDALADVNALDSKGNRLCRPPVWKRPGLVQGTKLSKDEAMEPYRKAVSAATSPEKGDFWSVPMPGKNKGIWSE